jgi:hypothetical protein
MGLVAVEMVTHVLVAHISKSEIWPNDRLVMNYHRMASLECAAYGDFVLSRQLLWAMAILPFNSLLGHTLVAPNWLIPAVSFICVIVTVLNFFDVSLHLISLGNDDS